MRPEDRERIQVEVTQRVVARYVEMSMNQPEGFMQTVVNDTVYHEMRRLDRATHNRKAKHTIGYYQDVRHKLLSGSDADQRRLLEGMARRFVAEVVGNFDERVYRLSTTMIPTGLGVLLNAMSPKRLLSLDHFRSSLANQISIQGATSQVRGLLDRGTLVVVPTHSSNLDSIILGYAVYLMGIPPLVYGAGLNLFTNPLVSFFMRNLGAYRVDRYKTAPVYKEVLKEYATCASEMGYHQLFFPGGTRSRSGQVEQRLKKGLMGTSLRAFIANHIADKARPNIYIVPCTLSYKLVLEAETLIGDHLSESGKARFIIDDDEFSRPKRLLNFFSNLLSLNDEIIVRFGQPMDVFGNPVDERGESLDPQGRPLDARTYISRDGVPYFDDQRDMEYTNELSHSIAGAYLRENVLMNTNVVARALFTLLRRANPGVDLYRLMHTGGRSSSFTMAELHTETEHLLTALKKLPVRPQLTALLQRGDIQEIVNDALTHFSIYHTQPAATRRGDHVFHQDRKLLYYYSNRLEGYDLPSVDR
ncbi:MAG: 1-acyl-sn-glycerol-3-phosphate acyltransferase [Deltaproteobacteria bacterium]|nr:1-acyl-sn-glycerol-3-phosphate acyltransferase [Deltaproteobacteria bacterium]